MADVGIGCERASTENVILATFAPMSLGLRPQPTGNRIATASFQSC